MKTIYHSLFQQDFSLAQNKVRSNPMNPLHRQPVADGRAYMSIGRQRIAVRAPRQWTREELDALDRPQPRNEAAAAVLENERRHR